MVNSVHLQPPFSTVVSIITIKDRIKWERENDSGDLFHAKKGKLDILVGEFPTLVPESGTMGDWRWKY